MQEIRVYLVQFNRQFIDCTNEEFITQAEKEGAVFTLEEFQDAVNAQYVSVDYSLIRFIQP